MQKLLGYSPLEAGAGLLPLMGTFALVSFVAGAAVRARWARSRSSPPARPACASGCCCCRSCTADSGYLALVPGMVVLGVGVGLFYLVGHHRGGDRARPVAREPRRSDHLHVPDRRRVDRARPDDDGVHRRVPAPELADDVLRRGRHVQRARTRDVQGVLAGTDPARRCSPVPGRDARRSPTWWATRSCTACNGDFASTPRSPPSAWS